MSEKNAETRVKLGEIAAGALRCISSAPSEGKSLNCENCPYSTWEKDVTGEEVFICDCDRLISDGADIIENDAREIAALRLALDRLRERVADE